MYKYIIWDFNGTILDDLELCLDLLNDMLHQQKKPTIDISRYKDIFGFPIQDYYVQAGISFDTVSFDTLSQYFIEKYQPASFNCQLNQGVIEVLTKTTALGIRHIILSASKTDNLIEQTQVLGIDRFFEDVIGTDNIKGMGKVQRGLDWIKEARINPDECLYVGDTIHDAEVAHALGVKVLLYSGGHQSKTQLLSKHEQIIDHISDIMSYIKR